MFGGGGGQGGGDDTQDFEAFIAALSGMNASNGGAAGGPTPPRGLRTMFAAAAASLPGMAAPRVNDAAWRCAPAVVWAASASAPGAALLFVSVPGGGLVGAVVDPGGRAASPFPLGLAMMGLDHGAVPEDAGGQSANGGPFERVMFAAMEHIIGMVQERSMMEQRGAPPAKETVRDALPRVVVTKEDQLDATNSKCAVCLDEYRPGMRATRMFCGHLFCTSCIREWLRNSNSCPVCRYELATDSEEYEEGRTVRMQGRCAARLRGSELRAMRIPELKKLMNALDVSGEDCLEKTDLISRLGAAPGIELMPDRLDVFYDEDELRALEIPLLRNLMERHHIACPMDDMEEVAERAEALKRFADAGWLSVKAKRALQQKRAFGAHRGLEEREAARPADHQVSPPESACGLPPEPEGPLSAREPAASSSGGESSAAAPRFRRASRCGPLRFTSQNTLPSTPTPPAEQDEATHDGDAAAEQSSGAGTAQSSPVAMVPRPPNSTNSEAVPGTSSRSCPSSAVSSTSGTPMWFRGSPLSPASGGGPSPSQTETPPADAAQSGAAATSSRSKTASSDGVSSSTPTAGALPSDAAAISSPSSPAAPSGSNIVTTQASAEMPCAPELQATRAPLQTGRRPSNAPSEII
eukprot:CAMPEP_0117619254 /NCGR_PEP_ID=MMETSP0784-20121206/86522_1 /TAXON_ID=39447 /ORGANISM="" /LENGTH=637 /DNA_ID=CAMNT_0005423139 /DNA_START=66 /DNA_END=1979 /DNA_ORIENTATION=-